MNREPDKALLLRYTIEEGQRLTTVIVSWLKAIPFEHRSEIHMTVREVLEDAAKNR